MVKMGMTGADRDATPSPGDNYTITLTMVPDCAGADIKVELANDLLPDPLTALGHCTSFFTESFSQTLPTRFHWSIDISTPLGLNALVIQINPNFDWDFSVPLFSDGFESGGLSAWSSAVP
jgi:hypothetical protein